MKDIIWKLLRQHISKGQLIGFAIANLIGLTIVLLAVQFYRDVRPVFNDEESFISKDYLIITRAVTGAGAMMGNNGEFSNSDIQDLENQPWCRQVGKFINSDFAIYARLGVGSSHSMHTQFFFEAIPDEFIDIDPDEWGFTPGKPEVPVVISRDYLSLYNFGFAATQGMPKISEGQAEMLPLEFTLSGNGQRKVMPGRIVGFSNRLNTVIVPQEFMEWANGYFGTGAAQQPQRLIVEVNKPGDVKIEQYMDEHHYEVAGDKMSSSKANYFLTVISSIVIAVGIIISLLSFFVLMLSIYLLLQKNTRKLQDLLLLGYSPSQVSHHYILLVVVLNAAVLVLAVILMLLGRLAYMDMIHAFGVGGSSIWVSVLVGLIIMGAITAGNIRAIRQKVQSLWLHEK
ncbi:MAG: ABC transporter permease [Muribaculaceae bacterium]|nr:ABC transporter permease [Muribaculaceae bacterium]